MKDFVKMTLAVICGLFIMGIIGSILFFGCIGAVASLGSSTPVMPRSGVLLMDLGKVAMSEQTQEVNPMAVLQGDETQSIGLWDAVQSIKAAAAGFRKMEADRHRHRLRMDILVLQAGTAAAAGNLPELGMPAAEPGIRLAAAGQAAGMCRPAELQDCQPYGQEAGWHWQ